MGSVIACTETSTAGSRPAGTATSGQLAWLRQYWPYRACDEASESHRFRCPDDEQRRIPRLSDQDGSGVAEGELDQPIRAWVDLVEYRRNAAAVARLDFVEGQVPLRLTVEALGCVRRLANSAHALRATPGSCGGHDQKRSHARGGSRHRRENGLGRAPRSGIAVGTVAGPAA